MHKYKLLGKKGEGTFSEVLKAQTVKNGKYVAIKRMKNHFDSIDQVNNLREIQALRRLSPHPNIIKLQEVLYDRQTGRLALVFELMDMNVYELIRARRTNLPEAKVKGFMYQLIRSMDHMHRNGIFHRDIKPENILLVDEKLKLADFGSCRGIYSKQPYTEYISTRWYRAPECLLTDGYYNYKMDMWGVGCVFFESLTRYPLFPGNDEVDQINKIHAILGTPPADLLEKMRKHSNNGHANFRFTPTEGTGLARLLQGISPECCDLITKLLAYNPDDRLSARQALRHPYFRDLREAEKRAHLTKSISRGVGAADDDEDMRKDSTPASVGDEESETGGSHGGGGGGGGGASNGAGAGAGASAFVGNPSKYEGYYGANDKPAGAGAAAAPETEPRRKDERPSRVEVQPVVEPLEPVAYTISSKTRTVNLGNNQTRTTQVTHVPQPAIAQVSQSQPRKIPSSTPSPRPDDERNRGGADGWASQEPRSTVSSFQSPSQVGKDGQLPPIQKHVGGKYWNRGVGANAVTGGPAPLGGAIGGSSGVPVGGGGGVAPAGSMGGTNSLAPRSTAIEFNNFGSPNYRPRDYYKPKLKPKRSPHSLTEPMGAPALAPAPAYVPSTTLQPLNPGLSEGPSPMRKPPARLPADYVSPYSQKVYIANRTGGPPINGFT